MRTDIDLAHGAARQRRIAILALLVLAAAAVVAPDGPLWLRAATVAAGLGLAAFAFASPGPGASVALLGAAIEALSLAGVLWQLAMPLALAALALASRRQRGSSGVRLGRLPAWETFVCAVVTPGALAGWVLLSAPDLHDITDAIPDVSPPALLLGAIAFALLNALFEEWIWRGVIQTSLAALFPAAASVALQAASFGAAHAHGFPRGWAGVALAGTWGAMLGILRLRSGGLLAPVVAHVVADSAIAAIVLLWLRA